jgi:hypothetical protein
VERVAAERDGDLGPEALIAGRYRIEARIGQGAMASVYRVRDEHTGEHVALKHLTPPNDPRRAFVLSQFEREYHTLCQLAHPSIIEVYDYGVAGEAAFYTMELLDGRDLREQGRLPWREACGVLRDVASSLAILHSRRWLHRDVSTRNVRCTSDGRAKLIDFGAMMPMGATKNVVGTPPFVPPEALQLQALDGRSDLFSLGALAYSMLTGRHAYPAKTFTQLRDAWRTPPAPLRALVPDAPEALERLVSGLLHLDRVARPETAAEVMERLSGITGLPIEEVADVGHAYLSMPTLVGREATMAEVRDALVSAMHGRGGSFVLEGSAGSGRTRLLDACVLEAKLLGALVLRGDASDSVSGDYGLVRSLCAQLVRHDPASARRHASAHRALLATMIEELGDGEGKSRLAPERRQLQAALRDFLLSLARSHRMVIAVDDVDGIDEPSAALLGALAHAAPRRSLWILLTLETGTPATPALSLLRQIARPLALSPLTLDQTEALLRSVFGDAAMLVPLAHRIHELAQGNPRWIMALAEHLVERGVARYEAGSWTLRPELTPGDLPVSLTAALSERVSALDQDARALGELLALTDATALPLESYERLLPEWPHARIFRALDSLRAAGVIESTGDRHRICQRELGELLRAGVTADRAPALHDRIAAAVAGGDDPMLEPRHLLLAGREREAIELLLPLRARREVGYSRAALAVLEDALSAAERLGLPARVQAELGSWLVGNLGFVGDYERFLHHSGPLLARLTRGSGLEDYAALDSIADPNARLGEALQRAQARSEQGPPEQREISPADAIPLLTRVCGTFTAMASTAQEPAFVTQLPSLEPLAPLSAAIQIVQMMIEGMQYFEAGRYDDAGEKYVQVLERACAPDRGGMEPSHQKAVRQGASQMLGVLSAARGQPNAPAWLPELEQEPGLRVNAWRIRMTYELMRANVEAAHECQRRAELLLLQDGGALAHPGSTLRIELLAYMYCEDVLGVKRTLARMQDTVAQYPRWRLTIDLARAIYRGLQGDLEGSLAELEALRATMGAPGEHIDWGFAATIHVGFLMRAGRAQEAAELGTRCLQECLRARLSPSHRSMQRVLSEALAAAGRIDEARKMADSCITETLAIGARGLILGLAYEARARVALAERDDAAFRSAAELCAREYGLGRNQSLSAKYERLMRQAEAAGLRTASTLSLAPTSAGTSEALHVSTAQSRLRSCLGARERADQALKLLLEATGAEHGVLCGRRDGQLVVIAASDPEAERSEVLDLLEAHLRAQVSLRDDATALDTGSVVAVASHLTDAKGRTLEPIVLLGDRGGETVVAAVAALYYGTAPRAEARSEALDALAAALLEQDDVDPVTCIAG